MPLKPKSKKRGSKSASFEDNFTGTEEELSKIIRANAKFFGVPQPANDDEAVERIAQMFQDCADKNDVPTVEKLALCLGTTVENLRNWENRGDKGKNRSSMIKSAKQIIAAIDAEAVLKGKLNTICYLFRAKNFYAMSDNVVVEHRAELPLGDVQDQSMLVGALLRQLQGQGQNTAVIDIQPQPQESAIERSASDFRQATMAQTSSDYDPQKQATIERLLSTEPAGDQATIAEKPAETQATMPSDFEMPSDYHSEIEPDPERLSSDYAAELRATFNPLTTLGKALAEELTPSDGEPGGEP